ncbi:GNAT family N-acetyltransferase [Flavobacterium sp.]|jgi:RimJ/RimL family protein N-acetyltransferase|uniref:GNAT family N-acetyltransferase n=1 Tax=Flavobacterium sp. TaxID=239 RepID=UPI002A818E94|nr:GNAT family N-acetyltransferase [Flavobacterium sp.]
MNLQTSISNDLITIKPVQENDFEALFSVASDELLWEQHPNNDRYKREVFQVFFDNAIKSKGAFVIIDNTTNKVIGSSRYYEFNKEESSIIIGYTFISRDFWGTKYNGSLKELMINYAFQFVNKIHFHVGDTNYRSQKAVEKLGAIKIGELPDDTSPKTNWLYELKK